MMHQAWVEVDLGAIQRNLATLREISGPVTQIAPVVKANAYGHGQVEVARAVHGQPGVWGLAVARGEEALALRAEGIAGRILTLGPPPASEAASLARDGITVGLGSEGDLRSVAAQLANSDLTIDVHLKINTGMCRMGVEVGEVAGLAEQMHRGPVRLTGVYSHFATAESADLPFAREQLANFRRALAALPHEALVRHTANSAGLVRLPEARFDLVRPGAILYGVNPGMPEAEMPAVEPALRLVSRIAEVKTLPPGCTVGYGRRYRVERDSTIALVPVGYGDGYPPALSGVGDVLIGGRRARVVGAVNMDSITVDVTGLPGVRPGDEVVLIGRQGDERVSVEELAQRAGTIPHEIPTRLGPRLPRIYHGGES
ncbi:MAG: alanine racemase [Armatimonadetes bacterium]|nr:alanine racemase [Armatimonadota bacterium]